MHRFSRAMIAFRHAHKVLRGDGSPDLSFHGIQPWQPDFSPGSRVLAFEVRGWDARSGAPADKTLYVAINMHWEGLPFTPPPPDAGCHWHVAVNTSMPAPQDIWEPGQEPEINDSQPLVVGGRSVMVLISK